MLSTQWDRDPYDVIASCDMMEFHILRAAAFRTPENAAALDVRGRAHATPPESAR
jgi:hypothetical protein